MPPLPHLIRRRLIFAAILIACLASPVVAEDSMPAMSGALDQHHAQPAQETTIGPVPWTPVLLRTSLMPQPFRGSEGKLHMLYDLILNNFDVKPTTLDRLELLDNNGKTLRSFEPKELSEILHLDQQNKTNVLPPGGTAAVFINLSFDHDGDAPDIIRHRITYSSAMFGGLKPTTATYEAAPMVVDKRAPVVIGAPVSGGNWLVGGGYASKLGHRNALFAVNNKLQSSQCYAIDWLRLDDQHYANRTDRTRNEGDAAYGQPVFAVADGTITGVIDRFPDQPGDHPQGPDRFDYPEGNAIVEDIGNDLFVMYAHLKPGSAIVKEGQKVKRAQQIAQVGNSGNTTGTHLHMHVADGPHPIAANGVPYLFDDFTVVGEVKDVEKAVADATPEMPVPVARSSFAGEHKNELPREGVVLVFPELLTKSPAPPPHAPKPSAPPAASKPTH